MCPTLPCLSIGEPIQRHINLSKRFLMLAYKYIRLEPRFFLSLFYCNWRKASFLGCTNVGAVFYFSGFIVARKLTVTKYAIVPHIGRLHAHSCQLAKTYTRLATKLTWNA